MIIQLRRGCPPISFRSARHHLLPLSAMNNSRSLGERILGLLNFPFDTFLLIAPRALARLPTSGRAFIRPTVIISQS